MFAALSLPETALIVGLAGLLVGSFLNVVIHRVPIMLERDWAAQCAEIAREGYETGKSLHDIVVSEKKLLTQEKWDEVFAFENLINPKFEQ